MQCNLSYNSIIATYSINTLCVMCLANDKAFLQCTVPSLHTTSCLRLLRLKRIQPASCHCLPPRPQTTKQTNYTQYSSVDTVERLGRIGRFLLLLLYFGHTETHSSSRPPYLLPRIELLACIQRPKNLQLGDGGHHEVISA